MKLEMKLSEIVGINNILKIIIDDSNIQLDALFKFKLLRIMKSIEGDVSSFETIRTEKIKEYGKSDEDGNIKIPSDDIEVVEKFRNEMSTILDVNVSVDIEKLKVNEIFNKGIKADYLMGLYPIIDEE